MRPLYIVIGVVALGAAWYLLSPTAAPGQAGTLPRTGPATGRNPAPTPGAPGAVVNGAFRGVPVAPAKPVIATGPSVEGTSGRSHF